LLRIKAVWTGRNVPISKPEIVRYSYFIGRYMVETMDGVPVIVHEFEQDHVNAEIALSAKSLVFREFELRFLEESEVPLALRNIEKLTSEMNSVYVPPETPEK
jgi:hypothetical protein